MGNETVFVSAWAARCGFRRYEWFGEVRYLDRDGITANGFAKDRHTALYTATEWLTDELNANRPYPSTTCSTGRST